MMIIANSLERASRTLAVISITSHQPDTSLHWETMDMELVHRVVCLFTASFHCTYSQKDGQAELTGWLVTYKDGSSRRVTLLIQTKCITTKTISNFNTGCYSIVFSICICCTQMHEFTQRSIFCEFIINFSSGPQQQSANLINPAMLTLNFCY